MRVLFLIPLFALAACSDFTPDTKEIRYDAATNTLVPPGPCPDWSHPSDYNYDNSAHSNYGCAVNNNIAVQIAEPHDWVQGHGTPGPDTETSAHVIERYRAGEIPEPLYPVQGGSTGGSE